MATVEFLKQWRSGAGSLAILARIDLPRVDGTQTDKLYISQTDIGTYADSSTGDPARLWQSMVKDFHPVHAPGGFGSTDLALCTGSLVLFADRNVKFPAGVGGVLSETLRESLRSHVWLNAKITIWRYFHNLADFKHAQVVLKDAVIVDWNLDGAELAINLRQSTVWNRPLTPRTVTRSEFPRAPDSAVGVSLPIVYGDLSARKMRRPWAIQPSNFNYFNILDGGSASHSAHGRAVLVDTGRGAGVAQNPNAKVVVAGHAVKSVYDTTKGTAVWMDLDGSMALLDLPSNLFNTTDSAGMTVPDAFASAYIGVAPRELDLIANYCEGARNLLDPNDTTFAFFDYAGLSRIARLNMPTLPPSIKIIDMRIVCGYVCENVGAFDLKVYLNLFPTGETWQIYGTLTNTTTPTIFMSSVIPWSGFVTNGFTDFGEMRAAIAFDDATGSPSGKAKVFFIGMIVRGTPLLSVVQTEKIVGERAMPNADRMVAAARGRFKSLPRPFRETVTIPAVTELRGDFYSNILGIADDAGPTYTGTANALIERAPDIMTHMLVTYGGLTLADIERGATTPGSFVLARTHLAQSWGSPIHAFDVVESIDLLSSLLWLTADSLSQISISPYDGRFRLNVWRDDPAVDYTWKFSRYDINEPGGPGVEPTPLPDVVTGIRVSYDYDAKQKAPRGEVGLSSTRSTAGHDYRGLRDQNMIVVAGKNDRLDYRDNYVVGGAWITRVATLTPGVYVPQSTLPRGAGDVANGLAQQVKAQFAAAEGIALSRYQVTWGSQVTLTYNDRLAFGKSTLGVLTNAFVPAGKYATCDLLAAACQTAANTALAADVFRCSYDRVAQKYAIWANLSTPVIKIKAGFDYTDDTMQLSTWASLGFYNAGSDVVIPFGFGNRVFGDTRIEDHFSIMNLGSSGAAPAPKSEFELLFQSGASGSDSAVSVRSCAELLGFAPAEDKTLAFCEASRGGYIGDCPKGNRETSLVTSAALYGPRRDVSIDSRTIHDTKTALALRNRIADLFSAPRTVISFSTRMAPDIERGNVLEFGADLDAIAKYPGPGSDGSWVGKKFMAVEVVHHLGPSSLDTEIVAVDIAKLATIGVAIGIGLMMGGVLLMLA